jgi:hypothetical protein
MPRYGVDMKFVLYCSLVLPVQFQSVCGAQARAYRVRPSRRPTSPRLLHAVGVLRVVMRLLIPLAKTRIVMKVI